MILYFYFEVNTKMSNQSPFKVVKMSADEYSEFQQFKDMTKFPYNKKSVLNNLRLRIDQAKVTISIMSEHEQIDQSTNEIKNEENLLQLMTNIFNDWKDWEQKTYLDLTKRIDQAKVNISIWSEPENIIWSGNEIKKEQEVISILKPFLDIYNF